MPTLRNNTVCSLFSNMEHNLCNKLILEFSTRVNVIRKIHFISLPPCVLKLLHVNV